MKPISPKIKPFDKKNVKEAMNSNNLHNIKQTGFKTPDTYFESFDDILLNQLKLDTHLNDKIASGFKVPEGYFETFDATVLKQLQKDEPKIITLSFWKKVAFVSGIAASLAILLTVFNTSEDVTFESLETASIENYIYEEHMNSYDIASFLTEDDLVIENFITTPISDESLESYLLDNTTIENLMIEDYE